LVHEGGGTLPHTLGVPPPPQNSGDVHVPQLAVRPPQPSETGPQFAPQSAHDFFTHGEVLDPQTFGTPPPPHEPVAHVPQLTRLPQPSAA
jgi:hypothetical protein